MCVSTGVYARTRTHVSTCEIRVLCTCSSLHCALRAELEELLPWRCVETGGTGMAMQPGLSMDATLCPHHFPAL